MDAEFKEAFKPNCFYLWADFVHFQELTDILNIRNISSKFGSLRYSSP